jgi:hypothetical protein
MRYLYLLVKLKMLWNLTHVRKKMVHVNNIEGFYVSKNTTSDKKLSENLRSFYIGHPG